MSLQAKILNLLSGISDPGIRMEISKTIFYLYNVYVSGSVPEEEIRNDLREICTLVISEKEPTLSPDELKKKVDKMVDDLIRAFKLESMTRRTMLKFKL